MSVESKGGINSLKTPHRGVIIELTRLSGVSIQPINGRDVISRKETDCPVATVCTGKCCN